MQTPPPEWTCSLVMRECRNLSIVERAVSALPETTVMLFTVNPLSRCESPVVHSSELLPFVLGRNGACLQIPNSLRSIPFGYVMRCKRGKRPGFPGFG
jgi:hypothetical protein